MAAQAGQKTQPEKIVLDNSSWLQYADYDPATKRLLVGFRDGSEVEHGPVESQTWIDFKLAPSKGSFYAQAIKKFVPKTEITQ